MEKIEEIIAYGHELVGSTHRTTFEITKEKHLTSRGDCVIAVRSNKSLRDLSEEFREAARKPGAEITITIAAGEDKEIVKAKGDLGLSFTHPTDLVVRKSSYICDRTLAVKADKAAADLSRSLVERLQNPNQKVRVTLTVKIPD